MKNKWIKMTIIAGSLILGTAEADVIFFDDFNGYDIGQASSDTTYASRYTNTSASITIDATTGLGGSQAWNISGDNQILRNDVSIDLINGSDPIAVSSLFFQWAGSSALATAQIGFTEPSGNVTGAGDLTGRISNSSLNLRNNNSTHSSKTAPSLTTNNWYQMVYTLERTATADTFNATLEIFNASNTGIVGSLVDSLAATGIVNADLWDEAALKPIIRDNSSLVAFDNYQVVTIPEPSSLALMAIAMGFLIGIVRKRGR